MKKNINRQPFAFGVIICILIFFLIGYLSFSRYDNTIIGFYSLLAGILLIVYFIFIKTRYQKSVIEYIKLINDQNSTASSDAFARFPLATAILRIDGKIMWYNELFSEMFDNNDLFDIAINSIMPDLKWSEILKASDGITMPVTYKKHIYTVTGNIISNKNSLDDKGNPNYSVILYFDDRTETEKLRSKYENERTDVAIINIDNYDDIFQKLDDDIYQTTLSAILRNVSVWVSQSKGVLKKTERDRYIAFFEHKYLDNYIKTKFDLLDKIRAIGEEIKIPLTVSIGIGTGGHLLDNEGYARAAIDMALGRGGDQAAIKDASQYNFYGGNTKDYEKSTRVKTRAFAVALKDFINHADKVIFVGHSNADYDSFGAAIGLQRAVRSLGKKPYIILDQAPAVKALTDEMKQISEYEDMLISGSTAMDIATPDTLLVILDTHRPSMLPCPELLNRINKIVLIDHHRRSTEFIENISLTYHEPYASSTCEMATEILQYIDDKRSLSSFEAMSLYMGILMDTKNFVTKTGVRTFEAASYLKRYGLDTSKVKKMFNVEIDEYMRKLDIVKTSVLYKNMAIATCDEHFPNARTISSQAADDMLNISGANAAFVIYPIESDIFISARSLGSINVQLIMEKLGGGGHMTVAGAQLKNLTNDDAVIMLKDAIDSFIEENN